VTLCNGFYQQEPDLNVSALPYGDVAVSISCRDQVIAAVSERVIGSLSIF
jgi:hypothetical protein